MNRIRRNQKRNKMNHIKLWPWRALALVMAFLLIWNGLLSEAVMATLSAREAYAAELDEESEELDKKGLDQEDPDKADPDKEDTSETSEDVDEITDDTEKTQEETEEKADTPKESEKASEEKEIKITLKAGSGILFDICKDMGVDEELLEETRKLAKAGEIEEPEDEKELEEALLDGNTLDIYVSSTGRYGTYTVYLVKELLEDENKLIVKKGTPEKYTDAAYFTELPEPELEGYEFLGWFTDKRAGDKITDTLEVAEDTAEVFYARYMDPETGEEFFDKVIPEEQEETEEEETTEEETDEAISGDSEEILDENGNPIKDAELDENGNPIKDVELDENGNPIEKEDKEALEEDAENKDEEEGTGSSLFGTDTDTDLHLGGGTPLLTSGGGIAAATLTVQDKVFANKADNYSTTFALTGTDGKKLAAGKDYDKTPVYTYTQDLILYDGTERSEGDAAKAGDIVPPGTTLNITVTGLGQYEGSTITGQFKIIQTDISKATSRVYTQYYTGAPICPDQSQIELKVSGKILGPEDYEIVGYDNNTEKGTGKITVRGIGVFGGEKTINFTIAVLAGQFNVVYNGNGSTAGTMANQKLAAGKSMNLAANKYVRNGFTFTGWNTASDGTGTAYADGQQIVNDTAEDVSLILYAQWAPITYNIVYHVNGGINNDGNIKRQYTALDNTFQILPPLKADWPEGYQFGGWFTEDSYKNRITEVRAGSFGDIHLYGQWVPYNYTVYFDGSGNTGGSMPQQGFAYGVYQALSPVKFTKVGAAFGGWALSPEDAAAKVVAYDDKQDVVDLVPKRNDETGNITLYAVWKDNFELTFETNGGSFPEGTVVPATYSYGVATALPVPVKRGYGFGGWFLDDGTFKKQMNVITKTTIGNTRLYAKWTKYTIAVSFNGNASSSGRVAGQKMTVEETYNLTRNSFARNGCVFKGWSVLKKDPGEPGTITPADIDFADMSSVTGFDIGDKMKAAGLTDTYVKNNQAVTLYAVWEKASYHVYYDACGGHVEGAGNSDEFVYGVSGVDVLRDATRAGYEFAGWYTDRTYKKKVTKVTANTAADVYLYAKWSKDYKVVFYRNPSPGDSGYEDPEEIAQQTGLKYDTTVALKRNAFKNSDENGDAYAFVGWSLDRTSKVVTYTDGEKILSPAGVDDLNELKLYAVWGRSFEITYISDGAAMVVGDEYSRYSYTAAKALPANVVRAGYTFAGWYSDENLTKRVNNIPKGSVGNKTLYAKWNPDSYKITFDCDAPSQRASTGRMSALTLKYTVSKTLTKNSYKIPGYTFIGWSTKTYEERTAEITEGLSGDALIEALEQYDLEGSAADVMFTDAESISQVTADYQALVTLYAVWKKDTYAILYNNVAGVVNNNPDTYNVDDAIVLYEPEKIGDTFLGWYKDANCRNKITEIKRGTTGPMTLYAKWLTTRYTVCYDLNAGGDITAVLDTSKVGYVTTYDQKYAGGYRLATATRDGYSFGGWYKDKTCRQLVGMMVANPTVNLTVYAKWVPGTYTVHFDKNDEGATGTMKDMVNLQYGTEYKLTANSFKKSYFAFTGWNTKPDGTGISFADKGAVKDLTKVSGETIDLYATWTPCSYTITYYLNGGTFEDAVPTGYSYGDDFDLPIPVRNNYRFLGWYKDNKFTESLKIEKIDTTVSGDLKLYAKWKFDVIHDVVVPDEYLDIASFGAVPDDGEDDLPAFKSAISRAQSNARSGGISTIYVPAGTYDIVMTQRRERALLIEKYGSVNLVMDREAILNVAGYPYDEYSIISLKNVDNVTVVGGHIKGERYKHTGSGGEYGHGVGMFGASNITISNMDIEGNWGDGVYLATQAVRQPDDSQKYVGCSDVEILNCEIHDNRRNNISFTDADDVLVDTCYIYDAHGTAPQCGIYIEPNSDSSDGVCEHLTIQNTVINAYQNKNDALFMVFMTHYNPYDLSYVTARDIQFVDCTMNGFFGNYSGLQLGLTRTTINGTVVNLKSGM